MIKNISRKDFLRLGLLTGAGFLCSPLSSSAQSNSSPTTKSKLDLIDKNDARYESLRKGFNKRIEKFPQTIALCTSTENVAEAIQYARFKKLPVAIKSGGHSMEGFSVNNGGMVVNLSQLNSVEVLPNQQVKAGPGCTLSRLYDHLLPLQRIIPAGSCGTVGLGGLTMGGGYGLFSREYGLTCDNLIEATMVDGLGRIHSTKDDAQLLWAIRGGGAGNFGVVTELTYKTYAAPTIFQAHYLRANKLDSGRAKKLLKHWFEFSAQLPNSCFSGFVLNGSTLNVLVTNFEAHTAQLQSLLESFATDMDRFKSSQVNTPEKMLPHYYGSLVPVYFKNSSAGLYKSFDDIQHFIEPVLEKIISTPGLIFQVNTLGGKINSPEYEAVSSYPHRGFNYISELQAYWEDPRQEERLTKQSREILDIFNAEGIRNQYINYCSLEFKNWESVYYGQNYSRLQAIKKKYDPDNIIQHAQSVRLP